MRKKTTAEKYRTRGGGKKKERDTDTGGEEEATNDCQVHAHGYDNEIYILVK